MNFLKKLFNPEKVDCPRCLGKGVVDIKDIQRLNRELYWTPGKCAYCNGRGKVASKTSETVNADLAYLTTDLSYYERNALLSGDKNALQRAQEHEIHISEIVKEIERLFYIENMEFDQIANIFLINNGLSTEPSAEKQQLIDYIEKAIKSKLPKK